MTFLAYNALSYIYLSDTVLAVDFWAYTHQQKCCHLTVCLLKDVVKDNYLTNTFTIKSYIIQVADY